MLCLDSLFFTQQQLLLHISLYPIRLFWNVHEQHRMRKFGPSVLQQKENLELSISIIYG